MITQRYVKLKQNGHREDFQTTKWLTISRSPHNCRAQYDYNVSFVVMEVYGVTISFPAVNEAVLVTTDGSS